VLLGSRLNNIIHQNRHQLRYSVDASTICAIWRRLGYSLALGLGLLEPFARYGVYDVKNPKFVCSWRLLEVCKDFLDEDGFRL
jgi:hypothetical protein